MGIPPLTPMDGPFTVMNFTVIFPFPFFVCTIPRAPAQGNPLLRVGKPFPPCRENGHPVWGERQSRVVYAPKKFGPMPPIEKRGDIADAPLANRAPPRIS